MGSFSEELGIPFNGRRSFIKIESHCLEEGGIVLELKGQIREGFQST